MTSSARYLSATEAANRLGVSAKALRLYEQRGLIAPLRTASGWRSYGPDAMARGAEIVALRDLGFSLAQVERVLKGDAAGLEPALAAHQHDLQNRLRQLVATIETVAALRDDLSRGKTPTAAELTRLAASGSGLSVAFELPYPWGGERFKLGPIRPLTYIVGPLGSGKTRLAYRIAETVPDAVCLGLDRTDAAIAADPELRSRIDRTLSWLVEDGATVSDALVALLAGLEADGQSLIVVDMIEQGLDHATQEALIASLRRRAAGARPIVMLTRSNAILDLASVC
jgi:DNA-binding transcriptional MerR regulator